ncbi:ATP-binding protein [Streptomyces sp. NPDC006285]|uniref:ATP-binding protein n=1 Tax=Streptomyces sp. NPDC006285 TaxID=3364742 RepID=UPI0036805F1C
MEPEEITVGRAASGNRLTEAGYVLDGEDGCIAQARHHALAFLEHATTEHLLMVSARARDLTRLVVSELVTNALKYAPGPVLMELGITAARVEITVRDSAPVAPVVHAPDPGRIGQHGLEIVKSVSEHFAVLRESAGKRVVAWIALA